MRLRRLFFERLMIGLITFAMPVISALGETSSATAKLTQALKEEGINIIFIRHALAPGYGDPEDFDLSDCSTQRNLNDTGIRQAQALGRELKKAITEAQRPLTAILSSQWCRCQDTAREMALGPVDTFAGLNSFFQDHADRDTTLAMLEDKKASLGADDLVVMVTHQVVISAATSLSTSSGGLVLHNTRTGVSTGLTLVAID